jgi:hypothetical protein
MGGYAGNRVGAIRDAKGKPVAVVFSHLSGNAKAEVCPYIMFPISQLNDLCVDRF